MTPTEPSPVSKKFVYFLLAAIGVLVVTGIIAALAR